jgi:hypothetical protein
MVPEIPSPDMSRFGWYIFIYYKHSAEYASGSSCSRNLTKTVTNGSGGVGKRLDKVGALEISLRALQSSFADVCVLHVTPHLIQKSVFERLILNLDRHVAFKSSSPIALS